MSEVVFLKLGTLWRGNKDLPLYRALYQEIRKLILSGDIPPGMRLPASRVMAKELSVSRNTIIQAIEGLQADGFLVSRTGAGVFVTDDPALHSFQENDCIPAIEGKAPDISPRAMELEKLYKDRNYKRNEQPFAPGRPALEEFPFDIWARLLSRRWRMSGPPLAMMENPAGYISLRHQISDYLRDNRAVRCNADQIVIVSGAQQGLDLLSRVLWQEGDRIVVEDPGFPGVEGVISAVGANPVAIGVDHEGMMIDQLNDDKRIQSFLVTPSRNYPTGVTMSLSRRMALLEMARQRSAWVVEDDFDSDFRFDGRPLSSLQGLDNEGRVIYVGSFSRIVFPALRLGFVVLPERLVSPFIAIKAYVDGHASIVHQAALADFFAEGYFASHLRRMRRLYKKRREFLIEQLEKRFQGTLEVLPSDGGLHICVRFLEKRDDIDVSDKLEAQGVTVRPLSRFYRLKTRVSGLVMGFAGYNEEQMEKSLGIFEKILKT